MVPQVVEVETAILVEEVLADTRQVVVLERVVTEVE
jgi:hypothetical protein